MKAAAMRTSYSHRTRMIAAAAGVSIFLFGGNGTARAESDDAASGTTSTSAAATEPGTAEPGTTEPSSGGPAADTGDSGPGDSGTGDQDSDTSGPDGSGAGDSDDAADPEGSTDSGDASDDAAATEPAADDIAPGPDSNTTDSNTTDSNTDTDTTDTEPTDSSPADSVEGTGSPGTEDASVYPQPEPMVEPDTAPTAAVDDGVGDAPAASSTGDPTAPDDHDSDTGGISDPSTADPAPSDSDRAPTPATPAQPVSTEALSTGALSTAAFSVPAQQSVPDPTSAPAASLSDSPLSSALGLLTLFGLPLLSGGNSPASGNPIAWALAWIVRRHQEHWHNQAPVATPTVTTSDPDTGVVTGDLNATDHENDPITYQVTTGPTKGGVTVNSDGTFTYTPDQDLLDNGGTDTFTVTVSDETGRHHHHFAIPFWLGQTGHTTTTTVTVVVDAVITNEAPTLTVHPPTSLDPITGIATGTITATDPDDDPLTYTVNGNSGTAGTFTTDKGSFTLNGDGTYTFTPTATARWNASFAGDDPATRTETLSITVDDGNGGTATQTVTIGIAAISAPGAPVGQAATSSDGRTYFTTHDSTTGTTYVTYIDPVTRAATTRSVTGTPLGGVQVGPNGTAYQTTTNGSNRTYITSFGGPAGDGMEYFFEATHTPVGNLRFDAAGNAYQVMSLGNNTSVYVIGADGLGKTHSILNEKATGPVVIGPGGQVYLTTERVVSGTMKTRISLLNPAAGVTTSVNAAGVPVGTVYIGPDGAVYQVSHNASTDETTLYRYSATLTSPADLDIDGTPYSGAYFDDDGTAYLLTRLADGNTQIARFNYDWGYVGYFDVDGTPVGDVAFLPGTNRGYFVTRTDGATPGTTVTHIHVFNFDAFPPSGTVDIPGEPVGGPVVTADGNVYQVITGTNTIVRQLNGSTVYQVDGTATSQVIGDGTYLWVTTTEGDQSTGKTHIRRINIALGPQGSYTVDGIPVGAPVTGADGTHYQTVVRYDADTDTYRTTVIVYNGDLYIYQSTIDGRPTGEVHIAPDGTVLQIVEVGGVTRQIVISGVRL